MRRTSVLPGAVVAGLTTLVCLLLLAPSSWAQQAGAIAGQVTDETSGALPGVTVEVAGVGLIGGNRVVVTDGEGRYNVIDLPVGDYTATFTLPGFSTVLRDGINISIGFTANIDATLTVGSLEETITVSGVAPVIDVQSVRAQRTLPQAELEALPSGNIGLQTLANVTPGFASSNTNSRDVGGTRDTWSAQGAYTFYHGKPGTRASFNGFRNQYFIGSASGSGYITNSDSLSEMQVEIGGMGAENGSGSVSLNAIPKDGSNTFTGALNTRFSNSAMHGANLNEELEGFGLTAGEVQRIYRLSGSMGGPIVRDKLWFYGSIARWGMRVNQPGAFFNDLQGASTIGATRTALHDFDRTRPAAAYDWYRTHSMRMTYQASSRNRFGFFGDLQKNCRCATGPFTGRDAIEAVPGWDNWPAGVVQGSWTSPVTSRLLLEAGMGWQTINWINFSNGDVVDAVGGGASGPWDRSIFDAGTGFRYGADNLLISPTARTGRGMSYFSASYVTGSHNVKVGVTSETGFNDESRSIVHPDGLNYRFINGVPDRLEYYAQPYFQQERMNQELGLFAQDAWTLDRMTLNLGLRFDYVTMGYPAASLGAGLYVPERTVEELTGVPKWTDINPRFGMAYDISGDGRTAAKASIGRFNALSKSDLTRRFHPFSSSVNSAVRDWDDLNSDLIPNCDLADFTANGECGRMSNEFFGTFLPGSTSFDDAVTKDNREYTWDFIVEMQHELLPGLSVSAGYNYNWTGNFPVTDNVLVGPSDYDEFCVTIPTDARIPNSGQEQCGFYDISPDKFGLGRNDVTMDNALGHNQKRYWQGVNFSVDGRFSNGASLAGGFDIGQQTDDHCYTVDIPNQPAGITGSQLAGGPFCKIVTSYMNNADFRMRGSYPLPYDFNISAVYKNNPGVAVNGNANYRSGDVRFLDPARTSLSRAALNLPIYAPNSVFTARYTQLDVRFTRVFNFAGMRAATSIDLYNALNSSSTGASITTFGSRFFQPSTILEARLLQVSALLSF